MKVLLVCCKLAVEQRLRELITEELAEEENPDSCEVTVVSRVVGIGNLAEYCLAIVYHYSITEGLRDCRRIRRKNPDMPVFCIAAFAGSITSEKLVVVDLSDPAGWADLLCERIGARLQQAHMHEATDEAPLGRLEESAVLA